MNGSSTLSPGTFRLPCWRLREGALVVSREKMFAPRVCTGQVNRGAQTGSLATYLDAGLVDAPVRRSSASGSQTPADTTGEVTLLLLVCTVLLFEESRLLTVGARLEKALGVATLRPTLAR